MMDMTDVRDQSRMIGDPRVLRALAHPARLEIMEHLSATDASVTATECAEIVALSPSATSYHLRELAKVGMVEQAPSRGDGRERVWRSAVPSWGVDVGPDADAELAAAEESLIETYLTWDFARMRDALSRARGEPEEWHSASTYSGATLVVTADELRELTAAVRELVEPLRSRTRGEKAPAGSRKVAVHFAAFPVDRWIAP